MAATGAPEQQGTGVARAVRAEEERGAEEGGRDGGRERLKEEEHRAGGGAVLVAMQ